MDSEILKIKYLELQLKQALSEVARLRKMIRDQAIGLEVEDNVLKIKDSNLDDSKQAE